MIFPDKNIYLRNSFLGFGAVVLEVFHQEDTVSSLWERVRSDTQVNTFEKFVLTLDFLMLLGVLDIRDGILIRND